MNESFDEQEADEELVDRIIDEVMERLRQGGKPNVHEYVNRYPQLAALLNEIFPALVVVRHAQSGIKSKISENNQAVEGGLVGNQLGDYLLLRLVGSGGMGAVYEARQISLDRIVGIKVLYQHLAVDPQFVRRFQREAQSAAKLQHPHIVAVYGNGNDNGWYYYAMQLIEGASVDRILADYRRARAVSAKHLLALPINFEAPEIDSSNSSPPAQSKDYFRWAAQAMLYAAQAVHYAHSKGIIHRDIKPSNLLVDSAGRLWVTDFGLAKLVSDVDLTQTGDVIGTLRYLAPEQLAGASSPSSDIYGLGITLYEMLALCPAFTGKSQAELLAQVRYGQPTRPRTLDASIPKDLETIVLTATEKDPRDRYGTAAELADDLHRYLDDQPIWARHPSTVEQFVRWTRRNRAWAASLFFIATMMGVVLPTILALFNWRLSREVHRTRTANQQAEQFSHQSQTQLAISLIEQAKWLQRSSLPTRRDASLTALTQAWQTLQVVQQAAGTQLDDTQLPVDLVSYACSSLALPKFSHHIGIPTEPFRERQGELVAMSRYAYAVADGSNLPNRSIQIFSLKSHQRLGQLKFNAFSTWLNDDGSAVITQSNYRDGETILTVWSIAQGTQLWEKRILNDCVCVDSEGQSLFALTLAGELLTYDLTKQSLVASMPLQLATTTRKPKSSTNLTQPAPFKSLLVSATRGLVALLSERTIVLVNSKSGRVLRSIELDRQDLTYHQACMSPLGDWIAIKRSDGRLLVYQVENQHEVHSLSIDVMHGTMMATEPTGTYLAMKSWSNQLSVWDIRTGTLVGSFKVPVHMNFLTMSPHGVGPIIEADQWSFWKVESSRIQQSYELSLDPIYRASHIAIAPDSRLLAIIGSHDQSLTCLDTETGQRIQFPGRWASVFFQGEYLWAVEAHVLYRWKLDSNRDTCRLGKSEQVQSGIGSAYAVASYGDQFAVNLNGGVALGKFGDAQQTFSVRKASGDVRLLRFSRDGKWLAAAGHNERGCWVYNTDTDQQSDLAPESYWTIPEFSPDQKYLALQIPTVGLKLYEVGRWDKPVAQWSSTFGFPTFSPDSKFLATNFEAGVITILDIRLGKPVLHLNSPDVFTLHQLAFSPDGRKLLYFSAESPSIFAWDLSQAMNQLREEGLQLPHLAELVKSVEILPAAGSTLKPMDSGGWLQVDKGELRRVRHKNHGQPKMPAVEAGKASWPAPKLHLLHYVFDLVRWLIYSDISRQFFRN